MTSKSGGFATERPKYKSAGYSLIPVWLGEKKPHIRAYKSFTFNIASEKTAAEWDRKFGDANCGFLCGQPINDDWIVNVIDVDINTYVAAIVALLDGKIVSKRGEKGKSILVRSRKSDKIQTKRFNNPSGDRVVDVLCFGTFTVVPPSIHPSGRNYEWHGESILDINAMELPILDTKIVSLIQVIAESDHAEVIISGKSTHEAMTRLAAKLICLGADDNAAQRAIEALFPANYTGNSLDELPAAIQSARGKVASGEWMKGGTSGKPNPLLDMLNHMAPMGVEVFYDQNRVPFIEITPAENGRVLFLPIQSTDFQNFCRRLCLSDLGLHANDHLISTLQGHFEAMCWEEDQTREVFRRIGKDGNALVIDLADRERNFVRIEPGVVNVVDDPGLPFRRAHQIPLPIPDLAPMRERLSGLRQFKEMVGIDDENWQLLLGFLVSSLRIPGPYFGLTVEGEQGSGKSFLCSLIQKILDPHELERTIMPNDDRELVLAARNSFVIVFDNVSYVKGNVSDTLCTILTGGGMSHRQHYTMDETFVIRACSPVVLNGIGDFANRSDLQERMITIELKSLGADHRRTESDLLLEFEEVLPAILGDLYLTISSVLQNLPDTPAPTTIRMADAAKFLAAAEPFLGLSKGTFERAILENQSGRMASTAATSPLFMYLDELLGDEAEWAGSVQDMFDTLQSTFNPPARNFFKSAATLSKALRHHQTALREAGLDVHFPKRSRRAQSVEVKRIALQGPEPGVGSVSDVGSADLDELEF